jgi:hypothetical protein
VEQGEHAVGEQDDAGERVAQHGQQVGAEQRPQERLGADRTLRHRPP